jgi:hypothetical protein
MHRLDRPTRDALAAVALPLLLVVAACTSPSGGAGVSASPEMMEHSAEPSGMMEHSAEPSGMMEHSAEPSGMMEHSASPAP